MTGRPLSESEIAELARSLSQGDFGAVDRVVAEGRHIDLETLKKFLDASGPVYGPRGGSSRLTVGSPLHDSPVHVPRGSNSRPVLKSFTQHSDGGLTMHTTHGDRHVSATEAQSMALTCLGRLAVFILVVGVAVYFAARYFTKRSVEGKVAAKYEQEIAELKEEVGRLQELAPPSSGTFLDFWPNVTKKVPGEFGGYLVSDKWVPLRAIARRPGVCFYDSPDAAMRSGTDRVVGYMETWCPYYAFDRTDDAVWLGLAPTTKEAERAWVHAGECFCWTTRECLSLEDTTALYPSVGDAKAGQNPLDDGYRYAFADHFVKDRSSAKARFHIAALPVLGRRDRSFWCVVRPEGGKEGYDRCWIAWDGEDPDVRLRVRTTRYELETYLAGVQRLLRKYKYPETKDEAHLGLFRTGVDYLMRGDISASSDASMLKTRLEGIPNLAGFLDMPIENDIQYSAVSERALGLLNWSMSEDAWDALEVSYPEADRLP